MKKTERVAYIQRRLGELYPDPAIPLKHKDDFTLLIAVLLSAQCTDVRVNQITPVLFAKARTPRGILKLGVDAIYKIIRPCGLAPAKSKAIVGLSEILLAKHGGQVPNTMEELEALPGVGHKTASVLIIQAFGGTAFPVDTHIHRLAKRWGLSSGKSVVQTERDLKRLFPASSWAKLHIQIIYYGREHCTARGCDGGRCEICRALK